MTKQDLIQHLWEEINNQNSIYITIIAIIITIFAFFQWQFSDKQVKRMKEDFKKEYKIDRLNADLEEAKRLLGEMNRQITTSRAESKKLGEQIDKSAELNIWLSADLIESLPVPFNPIIYRNRLIAFRNTIDFLDNEEKITDAGIKTIIISLSNAYQALLNGKIKIQKSNALDKTVQSIYDRILSIRELRIYGEKDNEKIKYFKVDQLKRQKNKYEAQVIEKNAD